MNNLNVHHSKLVLYPQLISDIALLLGNDYLKRLPGHGKVTILEDKDWQKNRKKKRADNGLIDLLAAADDKEKWLKELVSGNPKAPVDYVSRYNMARRYMHHAPVLEKDPITGEVIAVPLNPLPGCD